MSWRVHEIDDCIELFSEDDPSLSLKIDWLDGQFQKRLRGVGKNSLLGKALGLPKSKNTLKVVDATAGLLRDSLQMSFLGCELLSLEKNPVVYDLVSKSIEKYSSNGQLASLFDRITFKNIDSLSALKAHAISLADTDVVYLDPMFIHDSSALPKKELQVLRKLLGEESQVDENKELVRCFSESGIKRLVVKRPAKALLLKEKPNHQFVGKSIRYDLYLG